ncbi:LysR family transcriptional regulator [Streptomyces coacervatus]|uniref:LysR family transcriptional regulator n=1 Tax=Streptomyces coacervatus TaxID=647381 RepID=UPI0034DDF685
MRPGRQADRPTGRQQTIGDRRCQRQLEYFLALCEADSFSGAAAWLYVTQPSLSQQIGALEKEPGAALPERGRQGVTLTPAGRVFLPRAQDVVRAVQDAQDSVARWSRGHTAGSSKKPCVVVRATSRSSATRAVGRAARSAESSLPNWPNATGTCSRPWSCRRPRSGICPRKRSAPRPCPSGHAALSCDTLRYKWSPGLTTTSPRPGTGPRGFTCFKAIRSAAASAAAAP